MRLRSLVVLASLLVRAVTSATAQSASGARVSGVVYDSIGHAPLGGAIVQLVAAGATGGFGATASSDTLGRWAIDGVPDGRYTLGFFHPLLDTLGVAPLLHEVVIGGGRGVRVDLATPSAARLRAAICKGGPVVVGTVRDARDGAPVAGVKVTGQWVELSFTSQGVVRRTPAVVATTGDNGWFALCDVPAGGLMALGAGRGSDSTDLLDVQVPVEGFVHRELYLGAARTVVVGDTTARGDSLAPLARRMRVGAGRVSGTVVAAAGGRPLAGAVVGIVGGPHVRANERGEWLLGDAPQGTRMLEVHAVGYYPERRPVDVVADAPPVQVALPTLKAVLDTVKVTAARVTAQAVGFEERRRTGAGRYITRDDVARRAPIQTTDLLRTVPGILVQSGMQGLMTPILSRRAIGRACAPAVWINGVFLDDVSASEIDSWVQPNEIVGIEVYSEATVPPQYHRISTRADDAEACGSIVIWTK